MSSRFLFDNVFDTGRASRPEPAKPKPLYTDDDLAAARREGQEAGFRMGQEQAARQIDAQVATTLAAAAERLGGLERAMQASVEQIKADATQVALAAAGKLAPALIERQPLDELMQMVSDCLRQMPAEPRVVIRVADPLVDALQAHVQDMAAGIGFAGQLVLLGEDDIAIGDCRVEWADGGAERNLAALQGEIDAAVDRFCRTRDAAAQTPTAEPAPEMSGAAPRMDPEAGTLDKLPTLPSLDDGQAN